MSLYSTLLRNSLFTFMLKQKRQADSLKHWRWLQKSQFWSRQQLLDYQWLRLQQLLAHSYQHTAYYRRVFDEHGMTPSSIKSFEDLSLLPVLTRDITFACGDDLISHQYEKASLNKFSSGGTTGQQAVLYRDYQSAYLKQGLSWRHESWMGRKPCDKMALIWPAAMDILTDMNHKTHFKRRYIERQMIYHAGSFTMEAVKTIHKDLLSFQPSYLKVFPSALYGFTEFCLEHGFELPTIRGIMSTGEPLYPRQQELFERVFRAQVFDMYGSREVGNTACQCERREGLHIAMETSVVEFVENNRAVQAGKEGEILITDLTNLAYPLIRYRINDYGISLDEACGCGRGLVLMKKAVGRLTDDVWAPDGTKHSGHVLAIALTLDGPPIGQTQIVQKTLTEFLVRITNKPEPTPEVFEFIKRQLKKIISEQINVRIEVVSEIPKEKSGKTRFVISEVGLPSHANRQR